MAKREISSTLRNLKFMQRAAQREDKAKKQEEEIKPESNFPTPGIARKCVVLMEGDPHPGAVLGRMSFQSFNPSVDKLNEEAANLCSPQVSNVNVASSSGDDVKIAHRENVSSPEGGESSKQEENGDHKRKQSEIAAATQGQNKSPKIHEDSMQSSPVSSKGNLKQPKHGKLDWNVLRRKK